METSTCPKRASRPNAEDATAKYTILISKMANENVKVIYVTLSISKMNKISTIVNSVVELFK